VPRVVIVGLGYVGITTAIGLAKLGHKVLGFDIDASRVETLASGESPIFEIDLEDELKLQISSGRLSFSTKLDKTPTSGPAFYFICVPTPQDRTGAADLSYLESATKCISSIAPPGSVIVTKSTVPVGSGAHLSDKILRSDLHVASNPEFLREGTALHDFMNPDRVVVGADNEVTGQKVMELYKNLDCKKIITTIESAELIKYAANSYLAMRLSFVNDLTALGEKFGADISAVLDGVGSDTRIGNSFFRPGPGWGGSCFPKDTRALISIAGSIGLQMPLVEAALESNQQSFERIAEQTELFLGGSLKGKTVGVWGLAFKANTDDTRDSPALEIISRLISRGAVVRAYDPQASVVGTRTFHLCLTAEDATKGADALLVLTEWSEFSEVSPESISQLMPDGMIFDTRRVLDRVSWSGYFSNFQQLGGVSK
jgi:UDPglucose 6-dehydrogenase